MLTGLHDELLCKVKETAMTAIKHCVDNCGYMCIHKIMEGRGIRVKCGALYRGEEMIDSVV